MSNIPMMHVEDLKTRMDEQKAPFVLDVREPHEYQICNIGGHLIPLNDLPKRLAELDPKKEIVVHCRSGMRSAKACEFLLANGFNNVKNLVGGILAWAEKIDPRMQKY